MFFKKKKIDYDDLCQQKYKSINKLTMQANQEMDFKIKQSLYETIVLQYDEMLEYINQGATFDKQTILERKAHCLKQCEQLKGINDIDA